MKLSLSTKVSEEASSLLSVEIINNFISLSISNEDCVSKEYINSIIHLDKKQLSDLIGGLLHLQSKLRR